MSRINHSKINRKKLTHSYEYDCRLKTSMHRQDFKNEFFRLKESYKGGSDFLDSIFSQIRKKSVDGLTDKQFFLALKILRSGKFF